MFLIDLVIESPLTETLFCCLIATSSGSNAQHVQAALGTTVYKHTTGSDCCLSSPTLGREHPPGQHSPFLGLSVAAAPALNSALLPQLLRTAEDVAKMQEELESSRPLLAQAAKDTEATIEQIKVLLLGSPCTF